MRKYRGIMFLVIISILFVIIVSILFFKAKQYQAIQIPSPTIGFDRNMTSEELEIHEQNKIVLADSIQYKAEDIVNKISLLVIKLTSVGSMSCNEIASAEKKIPPGKDQYFWHLTMKDGTTYWIDSNGNWTVWKENIAEKNVIRAFVDYYYIQPYLIARNKGLLYSKR